MANIVLANQKSSLGVNNFALFQVVDIGLDNMSLEKECDFEVRKIILVTLYQFSLTGDHEL